MKIVYLFCFYSVISICKCTFFQRNKKTTEELLEENIPEDGRLNFTQLAEKYGHTSEEREVTTADGYILKLFRLNGGGTRPPVLLMHGLLDSADTFIIRGNDSLSITLANAGYDVWVGNCRGNKYSRRHTTKNPDTDKSYWDFSFHEFGIYDVPAIIDVVLSTTERSQLQVIGHSQGNLIFYVLGAEKPEYNDKISILIALNPICHLRHVRELSKVVAKVWPIVSAKLGLLGIEEIFRDYTQSSNKTKAFCTMSDGYKKCGKGFVFPLVGKDYEELEEEFFPVVIGHFPSGTSRKDADHQEQLASKKVFSHFDYGFIKNLSKYGALRPPAYNLTKVVMPVAMLAAKNDNIATIEDVEVLRGELPNVVHYEVMEREEMNHINFVWGKNMKEYLFPVVFDLLQKYES